MLSPVTMRDKVELGRLLTKNLWFFVKLEINKLEISNFFLFFQHFFKLLQNIENQQLSIGTKMSLAEGLLLRVELMVLRVELMVLQPELTLLSAEPLSPTLNPGKTLHDFSYYRNFAQRFTKT